MIKSENGMYTVTLCMFSHAKDLNKYQYVQYFKFPDTNGNSWNIKSIHSRCLVTSRYIAGVFSFHSYV